MPPHITEEMDTITKQARFTFFSDPDKNKLLKSVKISINLTDFSDLLPWFISIRNIAKKWILLYSWYPLLQRIVHKIFCGYRKKILIFSLMHSISISIFWKIRLLYTVWAFENIFVCTNYIPHNTFNNNEAIISNYRIVNLF